MNRRESIIGFVALGAMAVSIASFAQQQGKVWRVGFLSLYYASEIVQNTAAFLKALRELGYIEGKNLIVEWRFAEGIFERLPELAADLVQLKVDVIVAVASAAISAAKNATSTIPIVMATTGDPVGSGFVKSLARPGGNITGLSNMGGDTGAKLLDLLLTAFPTVSRVAVLVTPTSPTYRAISETIQAGARNTSVKVLIAEARSPQEIETAFAVMAGESASAVIVGAAPLFALHRPQIAELAIRYKMPSIFGNRAYVDAGGLMSYEYKLTENYPTGFASVSLDLHVKQLELLREIVPGLSIVAVLARPTTSAIGQVDRANVERAARTLGLTIRRVDVTTAERLGPLLQAARDSGAGALLVDRDFVIESMRDDVVRAARAARLPAAYEQRAFVEAGGLLSYGTNFTDLYRRAAGSVDKIIKGAKPGDLPIEQPTKFELVINLKTAKALGIAIPQTVQQRAPEYIE